MTTLLGANGLPLLTSRETIGPGRGARVVLTESTDVTFPGAKTLHMEPGKYCILTADDFDAMTGTGIAPAPGGVS